MNLYSNSTVSVYSRDILSTVLLFAFLVFFFSYWQHSLQHLILLHFILLEASSDFFYPVECLNKGRDFQKSQAEVRKMERTRT